VSKIRRDGAAVAAVEDYMRALQVSARDRAVAEAEEEVCEAWAQELARVRHVTELGVASTHAASQAVRMLVAEHQRVGNLAGLMRAQQQLEEAQERERRSEEAASVLLAVVAEEEEILAFAAEERDTTAVANRIWVSGAGRAVCALEVGPIDIDPGVAGTKNEAADAGTTAPGATEPDTDAPKPKDAS
jgi:hypothetical protein